MRPRAILFDMDGTVIPLGVAILDYQDTCRHFRIMVPSYDAIYRNVIGYNIEESMSKVLPQALGIMDEFVDFFQENQVKNFKKYGSLLPHVKEVFSLLKERKIKIGIVTTKSRDESLAILKGYVLPFDALVAGDDMKYRKPSPKPVLKVCRMLGVKPKDCIMIGDHHFDMMAAKSAGCLPVGVLTGWGNDRNLRKAGAKHTLKNLSGLISLLKR
jgi:HAD superfamily hydrolase (TIGR01549 family)